MKTISPNLSPEPCSSSVRKLEVAGPSRPPRPVIEVRHVGLRYRIRKQRSKSFQEYLFNLLRGQPGCQDFWPLKDVSLTVHQGEIHGLIGANGQGKSSLLRVLASIYKPDRGTITTLGKVSPLLTLGAGFNADLTGRENIYLNAIFLGLNRRQVDQNLDAIIAFADIGDFINQPIKTYSSGMTARLGFAIALHVEPDILLLDEVLGVGDESFNAKCRKAMASLVKRAGAVVLVSHGLGQVRSICTRVSWLDQGRVRMTGDPAEVTEAYRESMQG
jgi:homopolymeric O-antigen transport system ATP-binding protein